MRSLIRFWFTFEKRVDRNTYVIHGLALMALKMAVDIALVRIGAGEWWSPLDYARFSDALMEVEARGGPRWLGPSLFLWMLPFAAIGSMLTLRRALDAGISPWFAAIFFVPIANYAMMAILSILPSAERSLQSASPKSHSHMSSAVIAVLGASTVGIAMVAIGVTIAESYSGALFVGTPFVMGATSAYWFNIRYPASPGETRQVVLATFIIAFWGIIAFALEGAICLLMLAPLALLAGFCGGWAGRGLAELRLRTPGEAMIAVLALPLAMLSQSERQQSGLHEVRSVVEIDAPPDVVWRNVIAFAPLKAPTELVFRSGIAYPTGARIVGEGVGAVRYCEFSTGAFVEPITAWEPPRRLAFDVIRQPAPLREWSPWRIAPPHLDGYFNARRGEFRIVALGNERTRLEGSTWYDLRLAPEVYWSWFADALISQIHNRVLRHIATLAEAENSAPTLR
jgi:hypothetical protein